LAKVNTQPEADALEIEQDIEKHPAFMVQFYERKLKGTENLTQSDSLSQERAQWVKNRDKALKQTGGLS
jgi:hypothetical protein